MQSSPLAVVGSQGRGNEMECSRSRASDPTKETGLSEQALRPPLCHVRPRLTAASKVGIRQTIFLRGRCSCPGSFVKGSTEVMLFKTNESNKKDHINNGKHCHMPGTALRELDMHSPCNPQSLIRHVLVLSPLRRFKPGTEREAMCSR